MGRRRKPPAATTIFSVLARLFDIVECSRRRTVRGDSYLEHFRRITIWQCTDGSGRPATVTSRRTGARAEVLRLPRVAEPREL